MSWVDDLLTYLDASVPGFRSRTEGAREQELRGLEQTMGLTLPPVYREYLCAMGRKDGGLFRSVRVLTDVATLIESIASMKDEDPAVDFTRFIPVAVGDAFEGWALVPRGGELEVVSIDHNRPGAPVASSLPQLAFQRAFGVRIDAAAHRITFRVRDPVVHSQLRERAMELGFAPEWFCDALSFFGVRPDALLRLDPGIVRGVDGCVAAQDEGRARKLAQALARPLPPRSTAA